MVSVSCVLGSNWMALPYSRPRVLGGLFHKCTENTQNINSPWHTTVTRSAPHCGSPLHGTLRRRQCDKETRTPEEASMGSVQCETGLVTAWKCFHGKWQCVVLYSKMWFLQSEKWNLLTVRRNVLPGNQGGPVRVQSGSWHTCYPTLATLLWSQFGQISHMVITNGVKYTWTKVQ